MSKQTKAAEAYLTAVDRLRAQVERLEQENARLREQLEALQRSREMDFDHEA